MPAPTSSGKVRFGVFEADLSSGELRKQGIKIKLYDQPFKVLAVLLERPGEVVTREQLCERLWGTGTFVDSEVGLNSAVMKLRDALGDSAENPRFIETLPRRGYRLIVDVKAVSSEPLTSKTVAREEKDGPRLHQTVALPVPDANAATRRRTWTRLAAGLAIVAVLGSAIWWFSAQKSNSYTIAVLPLKNLSLDPSNDYFSDGLTDEIISNLSVIDGLQVKSRTSSFMYKDKPRDVHAIGSQLGASLLLDGSVLRAGDRLRVNVQLIRVSDDAPLWSREYDRELKDVFALQDEISRSIVNELRLKLGRGQRRYNTNLEAYDLYLKAESLLNGTPAVDSNEIAKSIPLFESAIGKDPNFAPAYAGIADAYAYMSASPRSFSPQLAYARMRPSCEKALQLDPLLPEAHSCMGLVHSRDREWAEAERSFRRALQLNPSLSRSREDFAIWVLLPVGRFKESELELRTVLVLDPLSKTAVNSLDYALLTQGIFDEVISNSRRVLVADPDNEFAEQLAARSLVQKGMLQEGITALEKLESSESFLGYAYGRAGRNADAEAIAVKHRDWPWLQALVYAGLGDRDRAIQGLQLMAESEDPRAGIYLLYPEFAFLRGDSRMAEIRKNLRLPDIPLEQEPSLLH